MVQKKVIAIIPAFNEKATIRRVIRGVKKYADEIIVVDDGSTDSTASIAKQEKVVVFSHRQKLGYDRSINDGFKLAKKRKAKIIFTFDADGQHNSQDISRVIKPIMEGEADLVVGKRPRRARITEYLFALYAKMKIGIDDPLCGLKAYRVEVYKKIGYFDKINSIGTELMFKARNKQFRIKQVEISVNKRIDKSRFGDKLLANWKISKALIKTILN